MALFPFSFSRLARSRHNLHSLTLIGTLILGLGPLATTPAHADIAKPKDTSADSFSGVQRIVAVGDVHGDYDRFVSTLKLCRIIDDKGSWIAGKTHLVQTGDVLDRGPDSKKVMDLLIQLEDQARKAEGKVHALIGNHEYMTIAGDLRYVSDGELAAFGDGPRITPVGREPACSVEKYRAAFSPQSKYGRWLMSHNAIVKVNDTLFMHGGLSPRYVRRKLSDLNQAVRSELQRPAPGSFGVGSDPEGPLWFRGLAESLQDQVMNAYLKELAEAQGAQRIVMGHTIQDKGISLRAGGKIALIDVGMSRWTIGGAPSCLQIERTGQTDQLTVLR